MTTTTDHASPAPGSTLPRRRPGTRRATAPRPASRPGYDLDRAWQLLAGTCELPATQPGLLKILTRYRHALYHLATELQAIQRPQLAAPATSRDDSHDHR